MSKRWIVLLVVMGLLVAVITTGAVMAQDISDKVRVGTSVLARVATILELDEVVVKEAFQQARKEQYTETYRGMLDLKVEKGLITSEQAEEQFVWFESRPDSLRSTFGHARGFKRGKQGFRSRWDSSHWNKSMGSGGKADD